VTFCLLLQRQDRQGTRAGGPGEDTRLVDQRSEIAHHLANPVSELLLVGAPVAFLGGMTGLVFLPNEPFQIRDMTADLRRGEWSPETGHSRHIIS